MADSTLDPDNVPNAAPARAAGHDTRALGPSDSSDSGSDVAGADARLGDVGLDADTDRFGTGERMAADIEPSTEDADLGPDRVVDSAEAGLGGGLDQAEEARLGRRDDDEDDADGRIIEDGTATT